LNPELKFKVMVSVKRRFSGFFSGVYLFTVRTEALARTGVYYYACAYSSRICRRPNPKWETTDPTPKENGKKGTRTRETLHGKHDILPESEGREKKEKCIFVAMSKSKTSGEREKPL
jgi:hypothetical protein